MATCCNPCYNGILLQRKRIGGAGMKVVILVIMEYSYSEAQNVRRQGNSCNPCYNGILLQLQQLLWSTC